MERSRNGMLHRIQRVMHAFLPEEQDFFVLFASAADKAVEAAECLDKLISPSLLPFSSIAKISIGWLSVWMTSPI